MKKLNQQGIGHIVLALAIVVLGVATFAGLRVMQSSTSGSQSNVVSRSGEPKVIKSKADVKKASVSLDNTAIDGAVNPASLDKDLNSLL